VAWSRSEHTQGAVTTTTSDTTVTEKTFFNNILKPYVSYSTTFDKLSLAARLDIPIYFGGGTDKATQTEVLTVSDTPASNYTKTNSSETKNSTFGLGASGNLIRLRTGVKYQVVPGKFSVQGGVEFDLPYYAYTKSVQTQDPQTDTSDPTAAKTTGTITTKEGVWTRPGQATVPTIGWTFNFTPTVALDMKTAFAKTGTAPADGTQATLFDNFATQAAFGLTKVAITAKF
jgi:hypothetical protein